MSRSTDWSGSDGVYWADNDERYDALLAPLADHLLEAAEIQATDRVLDVGCGCGATTRAAGRIAVDGTVLGVDLSVPMLEKARSRTKDAGLRNVSYELADAQSCAFGRFEVVMSQFGVMFFDDPVVAFGNLRGTGGRLVFLCWQSGEHNENRMVKTAALAPYVEVPLPRPGTGALSLADPNRIEEVLDAAGYTAVSVTDVRASLLIGRTVEEAVRMELGQPAIAGAVSDAGPDAARKATESLREAYAARTTSEGVVLGSAAWLVAAN